MITAFVRHVVGDYTSWKKVYDEFSPVKKEKGVLGATVLQAPDDPNVVIVTHDFENVESANSFFSSEKLKNAMKSAGVKGEPEVWFGEVVEKTPY